MVLLVIVLWVLGGSVGAGLCALWWDLGWGRGSCWAENRGLVLFTALLGPGSFLVALMLFASGSAGRYGR